MREFQPWVKITVKVLTIIGILVLFYYYGVAEYWHGKEDLCNNIPGMGLQKNISSGKIECSIVDQSLLPIIPICSEQSLDWYNVTAEDVDFS